MARYAVVIYKHLEKDRSQYQFDRTRFANNCLWHTLHGFLEGSTGDPETAKNPYLAHSALRVTFSFLAATASVGFFRCGMSKEQVGRDESARGLAHKKMISYQR